MFANRFVLRGILFLGLLGLLSAVTFGDGVSPNPTGSVKLLILGPDGKAAARASVAIHAAFEFAHFGPTPTAQTVQADGDGVVQFPWPVGDWRFEVDAKGIGYGTTGTYTVSPGATVTAMLPPLAPYATIVGRVEGDKESITFLHGFPQESYTISTDAQGRFSTSVRGGSYSVRVDRGGKEIGWGYVAVGAGETVNSLRIPPPENPPVRPPATRPAPEANSDVFAHGTIRDLARHTLAGVQITAQAGASFGPDYQGDDEDAMATTKSDAAGRYTIRLPGYYSQTSGQMKASKAGYAPQLVFVDYKDGIHAPPPLDVVMPDVGGAVDITVDDAGKPAAGATIVAEREVEEPDTDMELRQHPWDPEGLDGIEPSIATTDARGIAQFTKLPPGRYRIYAGMKSDIAAQTDFYRPDVPSFDESQNQLTPYAIAEGVAIVTGQTASLRVNIYPHQGEARLHVLDHLGKPMIRQCALNVGPARSESVGSAMFAQFEAAGEYQATFSPAGLVRLAFRYRLTPDASAPMAEPCYSAPAVVAVSPRLSSEPPVRTTAFWLGPATVSVELLDAAGKPARGVIAISRGVGFPTMIGSTNGQGRIRFDNFPVGDYELSATIADEQVPTFEPYSSAKISGDADLIGRNFVPVQRISISANQSLRITLHAQPAGYIRGTVVPPAERSTGEYTVDCDDSRCRQMLQWQRGNKFLIGPLAPENLTLRVYPRFYQFVSVQEPATQTVSVIPGKITTVRLLAPPLATDSPLILGHVYLADGKTPAFGATIRYFRPGDWRCMFGGDADATGAFRTHAASSIIGSLDASPPGGPSMPVIVAMLPGECGATFLEAKGHFDKPISLTLPPAIRCIGALTLGREKLAGQSGEFRVMAACTGRGYLNPTLSVWATPQPNGTFELAGLTPGTYRVQASLDNIWLSDTVTLVASEKPMPAIHLDIPQPGGPAIVHVASAKGKPLVGVQVIVDRPAGPLTELDWPAVFTSDGAGDVWIPALEAGKHTVRFKDDPKMAVEFTVPALPAKGAANVRLTER